MNRTQRSLLRKIASQIESDPTSYDQGTWGEADLDTLLDDPTACGTTCCIAGWASMLSVPDAVTWDFQVATNPDQWYDRFENAVGQPAVALAPKAEEIRNTPTIGGVTLTEREADRFGLPLDWATEAVRLPRAKVDRYRFDLATFGAAALGITQDDGQTLFGGGWFPYGFEAAQEEAGVFYDNPEDTVVAALRALADGTETVESLTYTEDAFYGDR